MWEAKRNVEKASRNPGLAGITPTTENIVWAQSKDLEEGIRAFKEKRKPSFQGR